MPTSGSQYVLMLWTRLIVGAVKRGKCVVVWSQGVAVGRSCTPSRLMINIYTSAGECLLEAAADATPPLLLWWRL